MKFLIINGPNLNFLGRRETNVYGDETLEQIINYTNSSVDKKIKLEWYQSNLEGEIVEKIQQFSLDKEFLALIINPGGYAHTSVAIHDALKISEKLKIEVHLSHVYQREEFRHTLLTAKACHMIMSGLGKDVYRTAVFAACNFLNKEK